MENHLNGFISYVDDLYQPIKGYPEYNGFDREFQEAKKFSSSLKIHEQYQTDAGQSDENKKKNRYKDILPFDHCRVKLDDDIEKSDYINASFIKGARNREKYIASQGPLPHTVNDFWRMLWLHNVKVIIMVCKEVEMGKKKCERYWAENSSEKLTFGNIIVTLHDMQEVNKNGYCVRTITAQKGNETRQLKQYHYNSWPDHGVPKTCYEILFMMNDIRKLQDHCADEQTPLCVHCSAGCGRTGTVLVVDYIRNLLVNKAISPALNVLSIVKEMRGQRTALVQTKEQYQFVCNTVCELFKIYMRTGSVFFTENEIKVDLYVNVDCSKPAKPYGNVDLPKSKSEISIPNSALEPPPKPRRAAPNGQPMPAISRPVSMFNVSDYKPEKKVVYSNVPPAKPPLPRDGFKLRTTSDNTENSIPKTGPMKVSGAALSNQLAVSQNNLSSAQNHTPKSNDTSKIKNSNMASYENVFDKANAAKYVNVSSPDYINVNQSTAKPREVKSSDYEPIEINKSTTKDALKPQLAKTALVPKAVVRKRPPPPKPPSKLPLKPANKHLADLDNKVSTESHPQTTANNVKNHDSLKKALTPKLYPPVKETSFSKEIKSVHKEKLHNSSAPVNSEKSTKISESSKVNETVVKKSPTKKPPETRPKPKINVKEMITRMDNNSTSKLKNSTGVSASVLDLRSNHNVDKTPGYKDYFRTMSVDDSNEPKPVLRKFFYVSGTTDSNLDKSATLRTNSLKAKPKTPLNFTTTSPKNDMPSPVRDRNVTTPSKSISTIARIFENENTETHNANNNNNIRGESLRRRNVSNSSSSSSVFTSSPSEDKDFSRIVVNPAYQDCKRVQNCNSHRRTPPIKPQRSKTILARGVSSSSPNGDQSTMDHDIYSQPARKKPITPTYTNQHALGSKFSASKRVHKYESLKLPNPSNQPAQYERQRSASATHATLASRQYEDVSPVLPARTPESYQIANENSNEESNYEALEITATEPPSALPHAKNHTETSSYNTSSIASSLSLPTPSLNISMSGHLKKAKGMLDKTQNAITKMGASIAKAAEPDDNTPIPRTSVRDRIRTFSAEPYIHNGQDISYGHRLQSRIRGQRPLPL